MNYDFSSLVIFIRQWFSHLGNSLRQVAIAFAFLIFYPLLQLWNWSSFLLDELFYPSYRRQSIRQPVFVIGMFRSGTTLLHRLLAQDSQFNTMMMWEVLFAPAIFQRKLFLLIHRVAGSIFRPLLNKLHASWLKNNPMHQVNLQYPEEDDYLLLHRWSTLTAGLSSGELDLARPYLHFDQQIKKRAEIMEFYALCVKKHLFSHRGEGSIYLAKNPALTPKLQSMYTQFPDAKVVFIVRSPLEVIPSFLSMMKFSWRIIGTQKREETLKNFLWEMAKHWYRYPLQVLAGRDPSSYAIIRYDDLIQQPETTIRELYQRLELPFSEAFAEAVKKECEQIKQYSTKHHYDLAALGLNHDLIVEEFDDIFQRFQFDTGRPHTSRSNISNFAMR